ncbi:hypothetical protein L195_g041977, partial [Trifolium pratense]
MLQTLLHHLSSGQLVFDRSVATMDKTDFPIDRVTKEISKWRSEGLTKENIVFLWEFPLSTHYEVDVMEVVTLVSFFELLSSGHLCGLCPDIHWTCVCT